MIKKISAISLALLLTTSIAMAMDKGHSGMNHGTTSHENHETSSHDMKMDQKGAMGEGVVNSVSKLNRSVNVTHAPIPELNWPEMKMDIAVAKDVDLHSVKPGDEIKFHIMLDNDKVYRIHRIEK